MKEIINDREVVIISNRHQTILHSVFEVFGIENHVYCYFHVKKILEVM